MLELKNINKKFKNKIIFKNLNIKFKKGLNLIYGKSGSGKSTLLKIIALEEKVDSGFIFLNKKNVNECYKKSEFRNKNIGMIFQDYKLIDELSVIDNILVPTIINKDKRKNLDSLVKILSIEEFKNNKVYKLSGGEQQRIAIARALINDPDIILADEPTGALDYENKEIIMNYLKKISKDKIVIMVTHDISLNKYGDNIFYIKNKKVSND